MERTLKPTAAGILNIVSGFFFLIGGIAIVGLLGQPMATSVAGYVMYSTGLRGTPSTSFVITIIAILAATLIVLGVVSLLGGIYSLKRSVWGLALAGSISTFISLIPLGIPATILTALSKKEFA